MNILTIGKNGQLAQCINKVLEEKSSEHKFYFSDRNEIDITDSNSIEKYVIEHKIDIVINCAAYTNVEKSEEERETAFLINKKGVKNIIDICRKNNIYVIHISTDFVFDGNDNIPYDEEMLKNPLSVYGESKSLGEDYALEYEKCIILRTSWLYSEFGKNFCKTMLQRIIDKVDTKVVQDQIGTPTYAVDLAKFIVNIINNGDYSRNNGIFHFSNEGTCSWYDFAKTIEYLYKVKNNIQINEFCVIRPCMTSDYPTKAVRPRYSVLNKTKIKDTFKIKLNHWVVSLDKCINELIK
jgi:dTDP-4-dehydrorhamnose reductase